MVYLSDGLLHNKSRVKAYCYHVLLCFIFVMRKKVLGNNIFCGFNGNGTDTFCIPYQSNREKEHHRGCDTKPEKVDN